MPYASNILLRTENPSCFFHFDLDRKAMGIPAALSLHLIALHGLVAVDGIMSVLAITWWMPGLPFAVGEVAS